MKSVWKRYEKRRLAGAVAALAVATAAALWLYCSVFRVNPEKPGALEAAILDYSGHEVEVLAMAAVENRLFVLAERRGHKDWGIVTWLERGLLGRYTVTRCGPETHPLYSVSAMTIEDRHYLILHGRNDLPRVKHFVVYKDPWQTGERICRGPAMDAPFVEVVEVDQPCDWWIGPRQVRYYDADGRPVDWNALDGLYAVPRVSMSTRVTMELGAVYFYMALILALGAGIAFVILTPDPQRIRRQPAQEPPPRA